MIRVFFRYFWYFRRFLTELFLFDQVRKGIKDLKVGKIWSPNSIPNSKSSSNIQIVESIIKYYKQYMYFKNEIFLHRIFKFSILTFFPTNFKIKQAPNVSKIISETFSKNISQLKIETARKTRNPKTVKFFIFQKL